MRKQTGLGIGFLMLALLVSAWILRMHRVQCPHASSVDDAGMNAHRSSTLPNPTEKPEPEAARVGIEPRTLNELMPVSSRDRADLSIRAVNGVGQPQARALVCVETTNSRESYIEECDADGVALMRGLAIGRVAVRGLTSGQANHLLLPGLNEIELVISPASVLTVVVVDAAEEPVAGAAVHVVDPRNRLVSGRVGLTDALGRCTIADLDPDRSVFVTKSGYEQSASYPQWPMFVDVSRNLRVVLVQGGYRLTGTVFSAATGERIDHGQVRVHGSRLETLPAAPGRGSVVLGPSSVRHACTGVDGRLVLDGLPLPPLRIEVLKDGFAVFGTTVDDPSGATEKDLVIRLECGASLTGVVVDHLGLPVPNAVIVLTPEADSGEKGTHSSAMDVTTVTNAEGGFCISNVAILPWYVTARAAGGRKTVARVDLTALGSIRLQLPPSSQASGRIVSEDGAALSRWNIGWSPAPLIMENGAFPSVSTRSDANGAFWLPDACTPGGWLYAWPSGPTSMPILSASRTGEQAIELRVDDSIRTLGSLMLRSSEPDLEPPLWVRLARTGSGLGVLCGVDRRAGASFHGLPTGTYELWYRLGGDDWRDAGTVELTGDPERTLIVPTSDVIQALPRAR